MFKKKIKKKNKENDKNKQKSTHPQLLLSGSSHHLPHRRQATHPGQKPPSPKKQNWNHTTKQTIISNPMPPLNHHLAFIAVTPLWTFPSNIPLDLFWPS